MPQWHRLLWALPPEVAHAWALRLAPVMPTAPAIASDRLRVCLAGLDLAHPVGLAAGFDKNGVAALPLLRLGFSAVEIGTVTPRPQAGNPRPRLFRLAADRAIVNRMGFNNAGLEAVAARLGCRGRSEGAIGVNIGINKETAEPLLDYLAGLERFAALADYLVVNVSSPNTPGLRALQQQERLTGLLRPLIARRDELADGARPVPLFVKIAPDLTLAEEEAIAEVALDCRIDGLIVSNTTVARPVELRSPDATETGGLSGRPLFQPSTELLRRMKRHVGDRMALVGVGGIFGSEDAWAKIRAGATTVQVYTGLVYEGPGLVRRIIEGLAERVEKAGLASIRRPLAPMLDPLRQHSYDRVTW